MFANAYTFHTMAVILSLDLHPMKKFWLLALALPTLFLATTSAASNCEEIEFDDATVCVDVEKETSSRFQVDIDVSDTNGAVSILCDVMPPSRQLQNVGACNGEFTYNGNANTILIYVRVNTDYKTLEGKYDFDDGEWIEELEERDDNGSNNNNNSNGDLDDFDITMSPTTPETDEWTDVTIEAIDSDEDTVDDYEGTVVITVQYKDWTTWRDVSSSDYDIRNISLDSNDEYDFDNSDNGEIDFEIKFDDEDEYRIVVEDEDENVEANKTFDVDDSGSNNNNSNGDLDNFVVTADDTTPSTSQRVDLTVKARDDGDDVITDFDGSIDYKIYYRSSSSSSWTLTTSSTYYEIDADFDDGYDFTSSDDWVAELSNFIKLKKNNYDYKIRVYDQDDNDIYKEITFSVGSSSNNNNSNGDLDDFDITMSPTTPETDEWTDVTIEAVDIDGDPVNGYDGTVTIIFQYKDGSTWRELSFGSYDIRNISIDSNDEYDFDDSEISFEIKFDDEDEYRIVVEDADENVEANKTFDVDDSGSSNNNDEGGDFDISISPTSPEEDEEIDVTIEALDSNGDLDDNYTENVRFTVQKKSGSSWVTASSSDYDLARTSYTFTSSDDGEKLFTNLLTFNREGDFRLKVYESDNSSVYAYQEIEVDNGWSSSSSSNGFTNSERSQVRAIYNLWPDLIDELEDETPSLRNNSNRQNDQEDLYDEMKNIIDQDDSAYADYDEFFDAFMDRYTDTLNIIN